MTHIIIGNQLAEEAATGRDELPADYRRYLGAVSHRLLWLANPGDLVVLPDHPDEDFVRYVWTTLGYSASQTPRIVVPPPGSRDGLLLYEDRLLDPHFCAELRELVRAHAVDDVRAFFHDEVVTELMHQVGLPQTPSRRFVEQSGAVLVNSKSVFRAVASGLDLPIPDGIVASSEAEVEPFIWSHIAAGRSVIVKQDGHGGGYGNEILKAVDGPSGFGASRTVTIPERRVLHAEITSAWDRWSSAGSRPVVVEEYSGDATPLYAEFSITGYGADLVGHGEMRVGRSEDGPTNAGLVVPAVRAMGASDHPGFLAGAERLATALGAVGYRGPMSVDSIQLPDGRILLNEFNGRISGSTHVHTLCRALLGPDAMVDRVTLVRSHRSLSGMAQSIERIAAAGLAFDHATRTGVLIGGDDGQLIIIAPALDDAEGVERQLVQILGAA